ncbi:hypothetical protein B0H16DRAFT_1749282 [Mycena metata]|uniref:Uncharacterized protein n=1 Tax=Mycena metata TaxID=1033252 RepID=A0AAD7GPS2_9AGAR|nr:hypothetical protein B0H16DRAFT_1749282 [Mycena metata]
MVPATDSEVTNVFMTVRRMEPRFPNFAYGFLYATEGSRRRTVAIPYNYGVDKLVSINDLFVHAWVPRPSPSSNVVNMATGRVMVDRLPDSELAFNHSYSIIYVPPVQNVTSGLNSCPALRSTSAWTGNILVVKHGKRKPIINVEKEDSLLVDMIVSDFYYIISLGAISVCFPAFAQPPHGVRASQRPSGLHFDLTPLGTMSAQETKRLTLKHCLSIEAFPAITGQRTVVASKSRRSRSTSLGAIDPLLRSTYLVVWVPQHETL